MTAKRRGRPPLDPNERQSVLVAFRVTASEAARLRKRAAENGQTVTQMVREAVGLPVHGLTP